MPEVSSDVGSVYGKYFLMKKLAAGGMGEIFLAKQQGPAGFQKIIVLKKILAHLTENKEFIQAFLSEANLAAQMNHRNIVQVFELGEESGSYFIAMEYVQSESLRDVIDMAIKKKEKLHPEICRQIAEQICDGASYAHNLTDMSGRSLNLVHRDLNPQNVLISYNGDVKIIDFGIAKSEMSTVKTEAGMIKGKFVYMSPEQSLAKKLDKRSDIFAIGITLYEMLTGTNPFAKNNIVLTLEAVQRFEPPPPSKFDPTFAPFDPIVAKALAKDRDRRYSDAAEMQDDLRRIVLPRPTERLAQFMGRIFRAQLEEKQKLVMDTDSSKLTNAAQKRTPAKAVPAQTPAKASPAPEAPEGATMMLPSAPRQNKAPVKPAAAPPAQSSAPKPTPRPPAAPPKKPQGAGDTLIDMGGVVSSPLAASADDEVPGGTAMLMPGQALPQPPPRKPAAPVDTMPEEAPSGATMMLTNTPPRAPARKAAATPPPAAGGSTNIMSPEESQAAQQEALAKMGQPGVVRTRTRPEATAPKKKSGKGLWIALGVGGLAAVGGIAALLFFLMSDDTAAAPRRRKAPTPVEAATTAPADEARPAAAPVEEKPAPAPARKKDDAAPAASRSHAEREEREEAAPRKVASGKLFGTLTLNPGPNVQVTYGGNPMPKQVGAFNLPVAADSGVIEVGDEHAPFQISLDYVVKGSALTVKVNATPAATVAVDGSPRGRTPIADVTAEKKQTVIQLTRPGQDDAMTLKLQFKPN